MRRPGGAPGRRSEAGHNRSPASGKRGGFGIVLTRAPAVSARKGGAGCHWRNSPRLVANSADLTVYARSFIGDVGPYPTMFDGGDQRGAYRIGSCNTWTRFARCKTGTNDR